MTKFEEEFNNCLHFGFIPNEQQNKIIEHFKDWQPQQALPVVPEWYANNMEIAKREGKSYIGFINTFGFGWNEKLQALGDIKMRAWLDGCTVEKPQQKRYEVKLVSGESMHFNPIGNPQNIKDYRFSFGNYAGWKTQFTKSELAEIMNGALYKEGDNPDDLQPWAKGEEEYINHLIELVPVEGGERK